MYGLGPSSTLAGVLQQMLRGREPRTVNPLQTVWDARSKPSGWERLWDLIVYLPVSTKKQGIGKER